MYSENCTYWFKSWWTIHQFAISLDRCDRSCNTLDDLLDWICVLNKTNDANIKVLNMIIKIAKIK